MTRLDQPKEAFDIVICVVGMLFVPDMPAALGGLASQARPGGGIALAVPGESFYEPLCTVFLMGPGLEMTTPVPEPQTSRKARSSSSSAPRYGSLDQPSPGEPS